MSKTKRVTMQVLIWLVSIVFLLEGITKLSGMQFHVENFARWDYPWWMMYFVGTLELLGSILIHFKKLTPYVVVGFSVLMFVAVRIHLVNNEAPILVLPISLLIAQAGILYLWWSGRKSGSASVAIAEDDAM